MKEGERVRGEWGGAGTNSGKHMRDTRVGRLPKHPKLFVRTCSRDLVKAQTLLLICSNANDPRWPVIFHFASSIASANPIPALLFRNRNRSSPIEFPFSRIRIFIAILFFLLFSFIRDFLNCFKIFK